MNETSPAAATRLAWTRPTEPDPPEPPAGLTVPPALAPRLEPLDRIVIGSQASLLRVLDRDDGGLKTLKLYSPTVFATPAARAAQRARLAALQAADAPGLLVPGEAGEADAPGGPCLYELAPWTEGTTLQAALATAQDGLGDAQARHLLAQVAAALAAVHAAGNGLIHGNVKPGNILLTGAPPCSARLLDWGSLTEAGTAPDSHGTAHYAAPERLRGEAAAASDWWSLGLVALEMWLGPAAHPLGPELKAAEAGGRVLALNVPLPSGIGKRLAALLGGLLAYEPDQRWGHDQITAWLGGADPGVPPRRGALAVAALGRITTESDLAQALRRPPPAPLTPGEWQAVETWLATDPANAALVTALTRLRPVDGPRFLAEVNAATLLDPVHRRFAGLDFTAPEALAKTLETTPPQAAALQALDALGLPAAAGCAVDPDAPAAWLEQADELWRKALGLFARSYRDMPPPRAAVADWFKLVALHAAALRAATLFGPELAAPTRDAAAWRDHGAAAGIAFPEPEGQTGTTIVVEHGWFATTLSAALEASRAGNVTAILLGPGTHRLVGPCEVPGGVAVKPRRTGQKACLDLNGTLTLAAGATLDGLTLARQDSGGTAIAVSGAGVTVTRCRIEAPSGGRGVAVGRHGGLTLDGCIIEAGQPVYLERPADGCRLSGNRLHAARAAAIEAVGATGLAVIGNTIAAPAGAALRLVRVCGQVVENVVTDGRGDGIVLADCPALLLARNRIGVTNGRGLVVRLDGAETVTIGHG